MERMKELVELLNKARYSYEQEDREIMSNFEYDELYDELLELEEQMGVVLENSPTKNVGYEVMSKLEKVEHEYPAKSLNKTKNVDELIKWIGNDVGLLSWKEDGLTTVLTYENGKLVKGVTRGNGYIGEDITHNVKTFKNVPQTISYKGKLVLRGESMIDYDTFNEINSTLDADKKYKNPRNLASGSVRQLDASICKNRGVSWICFTVENAKDFTDKDSKLEVFEMIKELGFDVVESKKVTKDNLKDILESFNPIDYKFPVDGLVLTYDSIEKSSSCDETDKYPKHSLAFKWKDDVVETTLRDVEWTVGKTGDITPTAIFDTVEIDGTDVSRASLHNMNIIEDLELGYGDTITVYKANMIIPQISDNLTRSNTVKAPEYCPVCNSTLKNENGLLRCNNEYCKEKVIAQAVHMVSVDCLDIRGLSEETIRKMYDLIDFEQATFSSPLSFTYDDIILLDGFKEKSAKKISDEITKKTSKVTFSRVLNACSIPLLGKSTSKLIAKNYKNIDEFQDDMNKNNGKKLLSINGLGKELYDSIKNNMWRLDALAMVYIDEIEYEYKEPKAKSSTNEKTFVITGSFDKPRSYYQELIESNGHKVSGSVSKKTFAVLVGEDAGSKETKARELVASGVDIKIISTEQELLELLK